jgi:hypothetical protein
VALEVEPELWRGLEVASKAQGGIGGDAALLLDDGEDTGGGDAEGERESVDREAEGAHEVFEEVFAGVDGDGGEGAGGGEWGWFFHYCLSYKVFLPQHFKIDELL